MLQPKADLNVFKEHFNSTFNFLHRHRQEFERQLVVSADSPLTVEQILRKCYFNPQRDAFPNFLRHNNKSLGSTTIIDSIGTFEESLKRIKEKAPNSLEKFNRARVKLADTSSFYTNFSNIATNQVIDKSEYLKTIRECKWYGPYGWPGLPEIIFLTINNTGNNNFYVVFGYWDDLQNKGSKPRLALSYWKEDKPMADYTRFFNEE